MPVEPLFPPWTNSVARTSVVALGSTVVAVPLLLMAWVRTPWVTEEGRPIAQPVPFDHRHHVADDGIACQYCHAFAARSDYAGIPSTDVCMGCHAQIWNDSPLLAAVRESAFTGEPIRWQRVHDLPDFVFFSHRAHVGSGVDCADCHGRVDTMPVVHQAAPLTMQWCLDCHRDPQGAVAFGHLDAAVDPPVHCTGCHR